VSMDGVRNSGGEDCWATNVSWEVCRGTLLAGSESS
jgi:hypothetical protein